MFFVCIRFVCRGFYKDKLESMRKENIARNAWYLIFFFIKWSAGLHLIVVFFPLNILVGENMMDITQLHHCVNE